MRASPVDLPARFGEARERPTSANVMLYRRSGVHLGGKRKGAPILLSASDATSRTQRTRRRNRATARCSCSSASRGGSDAMPAWWQNLQANPARRRRSGRERRRWWRARLAPRRRPSCGRAGRDVRRLRDLSAPHRARDPGRDPEPGARAAQSLRAGVDGSAAWRLTPRAPSAALAPT